MRQIIPQRRIIPADAEINSKSIMKKIKAEDKKRYVLGEGRDYKILKKIYKLEKRKLTPGDKRILNLIRTQLERDWRKSLIKFLDGLAKKYKKCHGK